MGNTRSWLDVSLSQPDHPQAPSDTRNENLDKSPLPSVLHSMWSATTVPRAGEEAQVAEHECERHHVHYAQISTTAVGSTTFGYQRALLNRLRTSEAAGNVASGTTSQKPKFTFIHDTLMFPGTLATLLGKASSDDVIPRMTPALLAGFHAHIDIETMQPILVVSKQPEDIVQGIVVYGLDKRARDIVRQHYRQFAHRRRALVEIDVCVKTTPKNQSSPHDHWHLERRTVNAYVWFRKSIVDCELAANGSTCPDWHLDDYLEGRLAPREHLRMDSDVKEDECEDGYIGRDIVEYSSGSEAEEREVVYSGAGRLDYVRASYNTGW